MPTSYLSPVGKPQKKETTYSQSVSSNTNKEAATVSMLLERKGRSVVSIKPDDTISQAVSVLRDMRIGALIVTGEDGEIVGILSERDIVRKLAETPGQTLPQSVSDNMTKSVVTCTPDDTLLSVLKRMSEGRFRHMPVVENGTPVGMLTIGDVVNNRLAELEHEALQLKQLIVG
ncbi:MAG: CBS domain-containing protein [Pseudomonadota bacterium]